MLLRQELRGSASYDSILRAIGGGATVPKHIGERSGIECHTLSPYLRTLESLGLIEQIVPYRDNRTNRAKECIRIIHICCSLVCGCVWGICLTSSFINKVA